MKVQLVEKFVLLFAPTIVNTDTHEIIIDATHKITIEELPNENIRLFSYSLIGEECIPMCSIEVEVFTKHFWTQIAQAIITLSNRFQIGSLTPTTVNSLIPEGLYLQEERNLPPIPPPWRKKKQRVETGTIHSTGKTTAKFQK